MLRFPWQQGGVQIHQVLDCNTVGVDQSGPGVLHDRHIVRYQARLGADIRNRLLRTEFGQSDLADRRSDAFDP
ncbi:hypothetical protein GCM10009785_10280 [Brooklawnia cerclae]